jgi:hypothetical protein
MDNNKKLIEEINRFRMMSWYQPGSLINEQKYTLINEQTYPGVNNITWMEEGFEVGSKRAGYIGKVIGTITDDVIELNEIGNYIFDKKGYSKTIDQIELLETQGKLKISDSDTKIINNLKQQNNQTEPDKVKRRDVRRSQKMDKKILTYAIESADWIGSNNGSMVIQSRFPIAHNVGPRKGFLFASVSSKFDIAKPEGPEFMPVYSGETKPGDRVDDFDIGKNFKTYKDNMVMPNLKDATVKEQFDDIVNEFVNYIDNGGFDKLTNVTIQGQADSANPTWDIPSGESSLDHSYGGILKKLNYSSSELDKMNLYLARERAKNYKNKLIEAIKEKTGKEIKIKELDPISYRGQEGKRGGQWRSILLRANAPTLVVKEIDPIKQQQYNDYLKTKEEKEKELSSGLYPVGVGIGLLGEGVWLENEDGGAPFAVSKTEPYATNNFTTTGTFIRHDIIDEYNIPKEPKTIQNAQFEFNESTPILSFTDSDGNRQEFQLWQWTTAAQEGNIIALGHDNGTLGDIVNWLGASQKTPGAGGGAFCSQKAATVVPFTVLSDSGRAVKYKGITYYEVSNLWFAYSSNQCKNKPPEIDYYSVPEIGDSFN